MAAAESAGDAEDAGEEVPEEYRRVAAEAGVGGEAGAGAGAAAEEARRLTEDIWMTATTLLVSPRYAVPRGAVPTRTPGCSSAHSLHDSLFAHGSLLATLPVTISSMVHARTNPKKATFEVNLYQALLALMGVKTTACGTYCRCC